MNRCLRLPLQDFERAFRRLRQTGNHQRSPKEPYRRLCSMTWPPELGKQRRRFNRTRTVYMPPNSIHLPSPVHPSILFKLHPPLCLSSHPWTRDLPQQWNVLLLDSRLEERQWVDGIPTLRSRLRGISLKYLLLLPPSPHLPQ